MKYLLLLISMSVFAADCEQDIKKYCAFVKPGKSRQTLCLAKNQKKLSKKCLIEVRNKLDDIQKSNPCFEDVL
jgi:hypothetical protein